MCPCPPWPLDGLLSAQTWEAPCSPGGQSRGFLGRQAESGSAQSAFWGGTNPLNQGGALWGQGQLLVAGPVRTVSSEPPSRLVVLVASGPGMVGGDRQCPALLPARVRQVTFPAGERRAGDAGQAGLPVSGLQEVRQRSWSHGNGATCWEWWGRETRPQGPGESPCLALSTGPVSQGESGEPAGFNPSSYNQPPSRPTLPL